MCVCVCKRTQRSVVRTGTEPDNRDCVSNMSLIERMGGSVSDERSLFRNDPNYVTA